MKKKSHSKVYFSKAILNFMKREIIKIMLFLIDRERLDATVTNSLIALAISRKYKSNIIIFIR